MPFCAAAALVYGPPGIGTFDTAHIHHPQVQALLPRVTLRANTAFDAAAPLSQARVTVRLSDGRSFAQAADGARGYPGRLTDGELETKFTTCAGGAAAVWPALRDLAGVTNVRDFTALFVGV